MDLPKVSVANEEIANFLRAFGRMQEEQKLFQFLNGLDDVYKAQRIQILIMHPLPNVETACSIFATRRTSEGSFGRGAVY